MQDFILPILFVAAMGILAVITREKLPKLYVNMLRLFTCAVAVGYLISDSVNGNASYGKYTLMGLFIAEGAILLYKQFFAKE